MTKNEPTMHPGIELAIGDHETTDKFVMEEIQGMPIFNPDILDAKLPEWEPVPRHISKPEENLWLTARCKINIEHAIDGCALLSIFFSKRDAAHWPDADSIEARRNATLRFLLAEIEKALPVLRGCVEPSEKSNG